MPGRNWPTWRYADGEVISTILLMTLSGLEGCRGIIQVDHVFRHPRYPVQTLPIQYGRRLTVYVHSAIST